MPATLSAGMLRVSTAIASTPSAVSYRTSASSTHATFDDSSKECLQSGPGSPQLSNSHLHGRPQASSDHLSACSTRRDQLESPTFSRRATPDRQALGSMRLPVLARVGENPRQCAVQNSLALVEAGHGQPTPSSSD